MRKNKNFNRLILMMLIIAVFFMSGCPSKESSKTKLAEVKYWTYLLQNVEDEENIRSLIDSHYDLVVLENARTVSGMTDFDMSDLVSDIQKSKASHGGQKLVIAYIDIGEAEDYRWYWEEDWEIGDPEFIVTEDPDGWSGNYPVSFWVDKWKDIIIYSEDSYLNQILEDGYDGIYLDWIEAFEDENVVFRAEEDKVDPEEEMIAFIEEIDDYCRKKNPDFMVIAQNGLELGANEDYLQIIDAVAQEQIWFDGEADANGTAAEGDFPMPLKGEYGTEYYLEKLKPFQDAELPIFTVDYALNKKNADKAYRESKKHGFIPYVSMRSLSKLSETPPPGY